MKVFSFFLKEYIFLNSSCLVFLSNYQRRLNNRWIVYIETTSHKTSTLYFPTKKGNQNLFNNSYFTTFSQPLKFIRPFMCISVNILFSNKYNTSNINITLTINNHTTYLVTYVASSMDDVLYLLLYIITKTFPSTKYFTSLQSLHVGISMSSDLSFSYSISTCSFITITFMFRYYKAICLFSKRFKHVILWLWLI